MKCHAVRFYPIILVLVLVTSMGAGGAELTQTLTFSREDLVITQHQGFDCLNLRGCVPSAAVGEPQVPCRLVHLAVPQRARVIGVEVLDTEAYELPGKYHIYPAQPQVPLSLTGDRAVQFVDPDPEIYRSHYPYPAELLEYRGTGSLGGQRLVNLRVYPVRYLPASGTLMFTSRLVLKVHYRMDNPAPPEVGRRSAWAQRVYDEMLKDLVENPGDLDPQIPVALTSDGTFEYLIITDESYLSILEPLAGWKTQKGWRTEIRTVDWITSHYTGWDNAEKVRNYLKTVYADSGTVWVLLAGDTQQVPCRIVLVKATFDGYTYEDNAPCDLYYSDLNGTWDANGNHLFGELADEVDMYPDLFVGRAPINSTTKAQTLVDKVLDYELDPPLDFQDRMVFMAEYLWSGCSGHVSKDSIDSWYVPSRFEIVKLYEAWGTENYDTVMTELNRGHLIANHSGHGNYDYMSIGPGGLSNSDFDILTNGERQTVWYTIGCWTAALDYDCIAEHWINNPNGGGIAYVGNSRYGFGDPDNPGMGVSELYDQEYFGSLFRDDVYRGTAIMADHKVHFIPQCDDWVGGFRWCQFVLNHLGEPELPIWTDIPEPLAVTHPDSAIVGTAPFTVCVELAGAPLEGGLVCLIKDGEVYEAGFTGGTGCVTLHPGPSSPGTMYITVTGHNGLPYQGSVTVIPPEGPYLIYYDHIIDDDGYGGSSGNNDGTVDAGETIELPVILKNVGMEDATGVTATLTAPGDPYVIITDDYEEYGDIGSGATGQSTEDYDFQVPVDCPDGHLIRYVMDITAVEGSWHDESMVIQVQAPVVQYADHLIDDTGGGNGNGVAEPGETVEIEVTLENAGSGEALDVVAELSSDDQYIDILSGNAGYGDILPGGTGVSVPSYQVYIHEDCPGPHFPEFVLSIETAQGQQFSDLFSIAIASPGFTDDMESGENGWTHYAVTSGYLDEWHLETYRSNSPTHSWKCGGSGGGDYSNYVDAGLVTPLVVLEPGSELTFWHWMDAEVESGEWAWDGGIVEISTDMGGTWVQIEPEGGYPYQIVDNPDSPFPPGTPCFSGRHDWKEEVFDLSSYSGAVYIRFRFGTDGYVTEEGWYIDDVKVGAPLPDVTVTLEPDATVIPRGGKLGFTATVTNNTQDTQGFNFWTEVILPNGKPYPKNPVIGPMWVTLAPGEERSKHASHRIPGSAPLGTYTYTAKIGTYPEPLMHSDSFDFTVVE
jgi:hypothetical protein